MENGETALRKGDAALAAMIARAGTAGPAPPVEKWNPPDCGALDIVIAADGSWHYLGSPIGREPLVRLFAKILRRDADGAYFLVTPVEKVAITVEDAPFLAVEVHATGEGRERTLTFRTNVGDVVAAGPDHPLRFAADATGGLKPYLRVRGRLEALATRAVASEIAGLLEAADHDGGRWYGVTSRGAFFPAAAAED